MAEVPWNLVLDDIGKRSEALKRKKTNAERIRSMTNEELASFITSDLCELICCSPLFCDGDCDKKMIDWLKQEVNDGKEEKEENQSAK